MFDFICISVLEATPDAKVFLILPVETLVRRLRSFGVGGPTGVVVWASLEDIGWTAGGAAFSLLWTTLWGVCGVKAELKRFFQGFRFVFVLFFLLLFSFWSYYALKEWDCDAFMFDAFCCADRIESISLCVNYLFIYLFIPAPPLHLPHRPPREHLTLPSVLSAMLWRASEAENGFNTTRAGVWTLLIDELRFLATRVAA